MIHAIPPLADSLRSVATERARTTVTVSGYVLIRHQGGMTEVQAPITR